MAAATEDAAGVAPAAEPGTGGGRAPVNFQTDPSRYRHWRLVTDGPVATLAMDVAEDGGLRDGYELKLNSYDLGVDIELYDAVQRLRFEHPQVRAVVLTSAKDKIFCAGANIRMLAQSPHPWKVNFCKFTNETRNGIEDATACSGQTYLAALNGTASGGGYELALACEHIMLDRRPVLGGLAAGAAAARRAAGHRRADQGDRQAACPAGPGRLLRDQVRGGRRPEGGGLAAGRRGGTAHRGQETVAARAASSRPPHPGRRGAAGIELTPLASDPHRRHDQLPLRVGAARP